MNFLDEIGGCFQTSSGPTPQWNDFYASAVNFFRKSLKDITTSLKMTKGHFYFSGFFTAKKTGQIFYFSISDVRFFRDKEMLIRTAKSYSDYTGGSNRHIPIDDKFTERIKRIIEQSVIYI